MRSFMENTFKFIRLATQRRKRYPEEIQVEITNACNLTCAMCPHSFGSMPQQDFSLDLFLEMVNRNPAPRRLVLTGWGEPLLHPALFEMVSLVNRQWPSTDVRFTTNGILLDEVNRNKLKEHRVEQISISMDLWPGQKVKPELQRFLHPSSPKTVQNLQDYYADNDLAKKTPVRLQCLLVQENFEDIKKMIDFSNELGMEGLNLVRLQIYPGMVLHRPLWLDEQSMIDELIHYGKTKKVVVNSLNRQNWIIRLATGFDRICLKTDDSLYITLEGTVTPCCNLRQYSIGSLQEHQFSIQRIWNDATEREFFRKQNTICAKCDALFHSYRK